MYNKPSKLAHYKYLLAKEKEVRAKEQEFIMELLKDKKLLELENIRLKKQVGISSKSNKQFIVRCGTCQMICQEVRPGKYQCPDCE